jgi:hypothetical protein
MRIFFGLFLAFIVNTNVLAQSTNAPLNKDYYHLIDRLEIKLGQMAPNHHSAVKPYTRKAIGGLIDTLN